ncbi:MAG: hypothetical protein U9N59_01745 [Campylobacterota bacterium]|nr:hypothetical protein [Campylobacterota bacterium]
MTINEFEDLEIQINNAKFEYEQIREKFEELKKHKIEKYYELKELKIKYGKEKRKRGNKL